MAISRKAFLYFLQKRKEKEKSKEELMMSNPNVYLLYGSETFIIDEELKKVTQSTLSEEDLEFNMIVLDMEETPIDEAISEAETMPFMGDKKIVICKKCFFLSTEKSKSKIEHDLTRLEKYVKDPAPDTVFIMVANYEKLDKRKKINKLLLKEATVVEASPANDVYATKFVKELAHQKLGVQITPNGVGRLLQMIGANLVLLDNEMRKMKEYVGEGNTIDEHVVDLLVSQTLEQSVFVLVEKVIQRKKKEALDMLRHLLKQNEEPIKIMSLLIRQIRIILHVNILEKQGKTQKEIATQLKHHPFTIKIAAQQAKQYTQKQLLDALDLAADTDFGMKQGKDRVLSLEIFMSQL